jgi:hypothetical protein
MYHLLTLAVPGGLVGCPCLGRLDGFFADIPPSVFILLAGFLFGNSLIIVLQGSSLRPLLPLTIMKGSWRLLVMAALFWMVLLIIILPLGETYAFGGDEGFEMLKAELYSRDKAASFWNDQPPLYSHFLALVTGHVASDLLAARICALLWSTVLALSVAYIVSNGNGGWLAWFGAVALIAWPNSLWLSVSAMLELPAWSLAMASAACLIREAPSRLRIALSCLVFSLSVQIKFTSLLAIPAVLTLLFLRVYDCREEQHRRSSLASAVSLVSLFVAGIVVLTLAGAVLMQGWDWHAMLSSHFSHYSTLPPGERLQHGLNASHILGNYGLVALTVFGVPKLFNQGLHKYSNLVFGIVLLLTVLAVHLFHWPFWDYYQIHFAIAFSITGSLGAAYLIERLSSPHFSASGSAALSRWRPVIAGLFFGGLFAFVLDGLRETVTFFRRAVNSTPVTHMAVIQELSRWNDHTSYAFCFDPLVAYHAKLNVYPDLALLPSKRFWSGDLDNSRLFDRLTVEVKPFLLVVRPWEASHPRWKEYLKADHEKVYQDASHVIFVRRDGIRQSVPGYSVGIHQALGFE